MIDCILSSGVKRTVYWFSLFTLVGILRAEPVVLEECDDAALWKTNRALAAVAVVPDVKYGSGTISSRWFYYLRYYLI
ncbi:MAG: hypothetical protein PHR77_11475 [Kiritimatiellae bacterium]|nr:hypothetical protein [Kiritimatiellia bacterium]MDD5522076.1 hypothetical protein [Kiritimatiellia bacterium]